MRNSHTTTPLTLFVRNVVSAAQEQRRRHSACSRLQSIKDKVKAFRVEALILLLGLRSNLLVSSLNLRQHSHCLIRHTGAARHLLLDNLLECLAFQWRKPSLERLVGCSQPLHQLQRLAPCACICVRPVRLNCLHDDDFRGPSPKYTSSPSMLGRVASSGEAVIATQRLVSELRPPEALTPQWQARARTEPILRNSTTEA